MGYAASWKVCYCFSKNLLEVMEPDQKYKIYASYLDLVKSLYQTN